VSGLDPPIFVVGCYRGGTTLLERVLLCHPEIVGPGFETQLFSRVRYGRALDHPEEYEALTAGVGSDDNLRRDAIAAFAAAVDELARGRGARCWVEKSPEHVYHARFIIARFAGARIVHVVRDARDVVTSILHTPWVVPRARARHARLVAGAVLWELMTFEGLRLLADPAMAPSVLDIHYECLVQAPRVELQRLAAFLGLPDDDVSIDGWLRRTSALGANSLIEPALKGIATSPVRRWRDKRYLSDCEIALVQYLVGPTLVRAGYELAATEPLLLRARARAAVAKTTWLAIRAQRYSAIVGRGAPPHLVADAKASLLPLLRAGVPAR
jgi:Sulfotransferase family